MSPSRHSALWGPSPQALGRPITQLLASAAAGAGDFRKRGPLGKKGPGLWPRPPGGGRRSEQEAGQTLRQSSRTVSAWEFRRAVAVTVAASAVLSAGTGSPSGFPSARAALSMMDLELPPPGLQSQQVLSGPWNPVVVSGQGQGRKGATVREGHPELGLQRPGTGATALVPGTVGVRGAGEGGSGTVEAARGVEARPGVLTVSGACPRVTGRGAGGTPPRVRRGSDASHHPEAGTPSPGMAFGV